MPHSANSTQAERCTLINRFLAAFRGYTDTHRIVGLLADCKFIGKDWFRFLRRQHIPICIRLKSNTLVNGRPIHLRFKSMNPGQVWSQSSYPITVYGVKVYLTACFTPKGEVLYLATASRHSTTALAQYARRWGPSACTKHSKGGASTSKTPTWSIPNDCRCCSLSSVSP